MNIREIVFPTDFSPASAAAGRVAREMALAARARLHLVHAVPPVTDPEPAGPQLSREAARLGRGLTTATALLFGRPAREIIAYALEQGADLIVMGTHGRTGLRRGLLGSVAEAVVRSSRCPVLTVPMDYAPEDVICAEGRALIGGETLEPKMSVEPAGRRGAPA